MKYAKYFCNKIEFIVFQKGFIPDLALYKIVFYFFFENTQSTTHYEYMCSLFSIQNFSLINFIESNISNNVCIYQNNFSCRLNSSCSQFSIESDKIKNSSIHLKLPVNLISNIEWHFKQTFEWHFDRKWMNWYTKDVNANVRTFSNDVCYWGCKSNL